MQHAILFDFNGVILDDEPIHLRLFNEGLAPLGYRIAERDYYEKYVGFDDVDCFTAVVEDQGGRLDSGQLAALVREKAARYRVLMSADPPLFPGAAELIRRLAGSQLNAMPNRDPFNQAEQIIHHAIHDS